MIRHNIRQNMRKRMKPKPPAEVNVTEEEIADFKTEDGLPVHTLYVSGFGNFKPDVQSLMTAFQKDGPIRKVSVNYLSKPIYAFVTFADVKSALLAKKKPHFFHGKKLNLQPADSWHQPQDQMPSDADEDIEIDMDKSILKLNDDCLFSLFSYMNIRELLVMEKVCMRFQSVAESIYKSYRVLDFDHLASESLLTHLEVRNISARIGPYVHTLKATATSFHRLTNRILLSILRHCNNLTGLYLEGFNINSLPCLRALARLFPTIKTAQLENCSITDEIVMCLREAKELETLDLSKNSEIMGDCITVLRNIKDINLSCCQNLQVSYFAQFCERNTALRSLNVIRCDKINHYCLEKMSKHLKNLERLMICNSYANIQPSDYHVLGELPCLKHLQVNFNNFLNVDTFLSRLADRDRLEFLDISAGHLTRNTQRALSAFTKLRVLKLNYKIECVDDTLMQISSTECLEELHIVGCVSITNEGLVAFIRKCRALKYINISGCYGITNDLIINILPHLDERRDILEIVVGGTQISPLAEEQIAELNDNPKIKLNPKSTAESFCSIDEWEDMMFDDDDDEFDFDDIDDDGYQFAFYDNGYDYYDSDLDDEFFL